MLYLGSHLQMQVYKYDNMLYIQDINEINTGKIDIKIIQWGSYIQFKY